MSCLLEQTRCFLPRPSVAWLGGRTVDYYQIGPILKEFRIRHNISQEELCFGLCATSTLSRIENGRVLPSRGLLETLFHRMGVQPPMEQIPMDKDEFRLYQLEIQIINEYANGNYNVSRLLATYNQLRQPEDIFSGQFHRFFSMVYQKYHNQVHPCFIHDHLVYALRLTLKDFREGCDLTCRYLSRLELLILGIIAVNLHDMGRRLSARRLMEFLKEYYETKIPDQQMKSRNYNAVLFHLSSWSLERGGYQESLALADCGIEFCMKSSSLYLLPQLLYNKGMCLARLERQEDAKHHIRNAVALMEYMGKRSQGAQMMRSARSQLGPDFLDSQTLPRGFTSLTEEELGGVGGGFVHGDFLAVGAVPPVAAFG